MIDDEFAVDVESGIDHAHVQGIVVLVSFSRIPRSLVLSDSGPLGFWSSCILALPHSRPLVVLSSSCNLILLSFSRILGFSFSHPLRFSSSRISVLSHCRPYVDVEAIVNGKTILAAIAF